MMIFGFRPENLKTKAVAVALSIAWLEDDVEPPPADDRARERLAAFGRELCRCLTRRADELAELADAVLCAGGAAAGLQPGAAPAAAAARVWPDGPPAAPRTRA